MRRNKLLRPVLCRRGLGLAGLFFVAALQSASADGTNDTARFSDQPAPLALQGFPQRPPPLLELGDKFLGTGNLQRGITLPTGEVISPNFWVFGTLRSAVQTFDNGGSGNARTTEWANRLDIYGNLQFSATERILVGWRPVDQLHADGTDDFSGYRFEPLSQKGFVEGFGATPTTLFFEGEFGEMFPRLDDHDKKSLDYGFAVGRQPITLQDGLLANNDSIDMVSVTRNSLLIPGGSTLRLSGLVAVDRIYRQDYFTPDVNNELDRDNVLFGLDGAADFSVSTVEGDLLYNADTSGGNANAVYAGVGFIQRIGKINTTFRAVTSVAVDGPNSEATTGTLLLSEFSYTLPSSVDIVYMNAYWGIDRFSSATRDPTEGGPLGDLGILNAAVGLGSYGAPLSNQADHSVGGAIGYQMFFDELHRKQLVFEIGGRGPTQTPELVRQEAAEGLGIQYQQAFGRRFVLVASTFGVTRDESGLSVGGRMEWETKF
jgi:hypothetical protein